MFTLEDIDAYHEDGGLDGFQSGRDAAIADWKAKKEEAEYKLVFLRLQQRNWVRCARLDPAKRAKEAEYFRGKRVERAARARRVNREKYETVVNQCENVECGHVWEVEYGPGCPRRSRFCSNKCRDKARIRPKTRVDFKEIVLPILPATAKEIVIATGIKMASLLTVLTRWTNEGLVTRRGRPWRYETIV